MDYRFTRDIYGNFQATFSMGHEAFGHWLSNEIGSQNTLLCHIIEQSKQIQSAKEATFELQGTEFHLQLNEQQAIVTHNLILEDHLQTKEPLEEEQDIHFYDDELMAECGLQDFLLILKAWQEFI